MPSREKSIGIAQAHGQAADCAALSCCCTPPACFLCPQPGPPLDLNTMADLFLQRNMVREATAFLLDVLQVGALASPYALPSCPAAAR